MPSRNQRVGRPSRSSSNQVSPRPNSAQLLYAFLKDWAKVQEGDPIRILTDRRLAGEADFVIQIDEYDFRLRLFDAPTGRPYLAVEQLAECQQLLEDNPSTVALLLTWGTDEWLTIPLTIARLRFLQQKPRVLPRLLSRARPLLGVLQELIDRQITHWEKGLDLSERTADQPLDIWQAFALSLEEAFEKERNRSYRQPARKMAAHRFPVESEKEALLAVFDEALQGTSTNELIKMLTETA